MSNMTDFRLPYINSFFKSDLLNYLRKGYSLASSALLLYLVIVDVNIVVMQGWYYGYHENILRG